VPRVDVVELVRPDPLVLEVVHLEPAIGRDTTREDEYVRSTDSTHTIGEGISEKNLLAWLDGADVGAENVGVGVLEGCR